MIDKFENLTRKEFIQYICMTIDKFYFMYEYLTEKEKKYINEFIEKLEEINEIDKIDRI